MSVAELEAVARRVTDKGNEELKRRATRWQAHIAELQRIFESASLKFYPDPSAAEMVTTILEGPVITDYLRVRDWQKKCTASRKGHWRLAGTLLSEVEKSRGSELQTLRQTLNSLQMELRRQQGNIEDAVEPALRSARESRRKQNKDMIGNRSDFVKVVMAAAFLIGLCLVVVGTIREKLSGPSSGNTSLLLLGGALCWGGFLVAPIPVLIGVLVAQGIHRSILGALANRSEAAASQYRKYLEMERLPVHRERIRHLESAISHQVRLVDSTSLAFGRVRDRMAQLKINAGPTSVRATVTSADGPMGGMCQRGPWLDQTTEPSEPADHHQVISVGREEARETEFAGRVGDSRYVPRSYVPMRTEAELRKRARSILKGGLFFVGTFAAIIFLIGLLAREVLILGIFSGLALVTGSVFMIASYNKQIASIQRGNSNDSGGSGQSP